MEGIGFESTSSLAAAQANNNQTINIHSPPIQVNVQVEGGQVTNGPSQEKEKPGGSRHDDLMNCVYVHRTNGVGWREMPEAVARDGFYKHSKTILNKWYKDKNSS